MTEKSLNMKTINTFTDVREGIKIYSNLVYILEKINYEKTFDKIAEMFDEVFQHEMNFTIKGALTRIKATKARLA